MSDVYDKPAPNPKRTDYGFKFGAADVIAAASDGRGDVAIIVRTPRSEIKVHVTPSGLLRVYMNGMRVLTTK